jgi:hypothetical protein
VSDLPIKAVLDTTAVLAYTQGNVGLGEIISEITDEQGGFAVPDICLIEAARQLERDEWPTLDLLIRHSQCVRLELSTDWRDLAAAARQLGSTSRAAAMLAAVDYRAVLLTTEPEAYGDDALPVIAV